MYLECIEMEKLINSIELINRKMAKLAGWAALTMVFCQVFSVVARYVFSYGISSVQEVVIYGHATLFLFGAAFLLQINQHVRVDIFYAMFSHARRRVVDIVAMLCFVLPVSTVIAMTAWVYVANSWGAFEGSPQAGGIPAIFLLKTCILIFAVSVGLQALATTVKLFTSDERSPWILPNEEVE